MRLREATLVRRSCTNRFGKLIEIQDSVPLGKKYLVDLDHTYKEGDVVKMSPIFGQPIRASADLIWATSEGRADRGGFIAIGLLEISNEASDDPTDVR